MSLFPRFSQEVRPLFRLLEEPFFHSSPLIQHSRRVFQPNFDVRETKDAYELSGELPGVNDKSKLDIQFVDAQTLVVKGKVERNRSHGTPPNGDESATTSVAAEAEAEAAKKPPKPTVEDEPEEASSSVNSTPSQSSSSPRSKEVSKAENNGYKVWVSERMRGEFQRSFSFPAPVDQDAVKASLRDGILSIVVPKQEIKKLRKIDIE